ATVEVAEADLPVAMPLPDPVAMPRPDAAARRGILDVPDAVPASDFALALTAAIRGEAHARLVQLSLEYDPAPPFDSGSPDRADADTLARYQALAAKSAPGRDARTAAAAARLNQG
ncbi:MAG: hypothetical protein K2P79_03175, partial [Sphingomonas sp.]|nr:hypothetical protein [Sphingomonas sp.]